MARKVYISMKVFTEICKFSAQYASNYILKSKWVESMGYLFCRKDGDKYLIEDAAGITRGGETYVSMTPDDLAKIEQLQADHPNHFLGGWFHTHPGLSPFFSTTDVQNQMFYQAQNEDGLGLVFDHSMVSSKFVGFKNFRLNDPQSPTTDYSDVDWIPLGWTEAGLEEALKPIGVSQKIIENLAFHLKLRDKPPASELPPFTLPKVTDVNQMINNCHSNALQALKSGDFLRALIPKRIEIALTEKTDFEAHVDNMLDFIEWALDGDRTLSAEEMVQRLGIYADEKRFPKDLEKYYTGKYRYLRGLVMQKLFQYGLAVEQYELCFSPLEEEDYFADCSKAAFHIAECYEIQKEYRRCTEALEKANNYLQKGLVDAKENEDDDELAYLEKMTPEIVRFQTRIKAKTLALNKGTGPQRII